MPHPKCLEEWRDARKDIFDNDMSKITEQNKARWARLAKAEHALMEYANGQA